MSTVLGRWPLIPENHCTVSLPQEMIGASIMPDGDAPNIYCERRLQIDLAKIASNTLSQNSGKPCTEPGIIDKHMETLKTDLIEKLPPAFRLENPEEKWDEQLPDLGRQRQIYRISVFATICILLRPMIIMPPNAVRTLSASDRKLVVKHRMSLVDAAMQLLDGVAKLHSLMGGKHHRFFLLSFFTLEPAVLLGIYLMTPKFGAKEGRQGSSAPKSSRGTAAEERDMWKNAFQKMKEAVARFRMLSEVSSIARTGLKVIEKMLVMINNTHMARSVTDEDEPKSNPRSPKSRSPNSNVSRSRASTLSQPSSYPPSLTDGSSVASVFGQVNAGKAPGNCIMPPFSYDYVHNQDNPPLINDTYNLENHDGDGPYGTTMSWDMNLNNGNMTNNVPFLNSASSMPWPEFTAQTAACDASLMDTYHFGPDIPMDQCLDWSWMANPGQQTAWFGT